MSQENKYFMIDHNCVQKSQIHYDWQVDFICCKPPAMLINGQGINISERHWLMKVSLQSLLTH